MILPIRYLVQPDIHGVTDVIATLYDDTDTIIGTHTLSEIGSTSVYSANAEVLVTYCWVIVESISLSIKAIIRLAPSTVTLSSDLSFLIHAETGTWKRNGSILSYYDPAMVLIAEYLLTNASGVPTSDPTLVSNRVRIGP